MENDVIKMAIAPAVAHPMISTKDVTRICLPSSIEKEVRSSYMDFKYIMPLYPRRKVARPFPEMWT